MKRKKQQLNNLGRWTLFITTAFFGVLFLYVAGCFVKIAVTGQTRGTDLYEFALEKYLVEAKRTAGYSDNEKIGPGTLYALTYLPGYAKNDILSDRNNNETKKYYAGNEGLDLDSDGKITKAELAKRIQDKNA